MNLGEWWIDDDGHVAYADGDVGDVNHEGHAWDVLYGQFCDELYSTDPWCDLSLSEESDPCGLRTEVNDQTDAMLRAGRIDEAQYDDPWPFIQEALEWDDRQMACLTENTDQGTPDMRLFAQEKWGWIRVADTCVELYGLSQGHLDTLKRGMENIMDEQGIELWDEDLEIYDHKSGRRFSVPWEAVENRDMSAFTVRNSVALG